MKIQFESDQPFQQHAIQAIVDVFEGQPLTASQRRMRWDVDRQGYLSELGFGNQCALSDVAVLQNVQKVQGRQNLPISEGLAGWHFSIEMETGTGKTYVYLRTIYELHKTYGFTKFIVVVPSVAIREGVLKNLDITRDHFATLYGNVPVDYWVYDSKRVSTVRQFATANQLQILIINIDAFNKKDNNVIHQERDTMSGYRPIEYIQATQPIVIVDEPQNMETDQARAAIESLHPLCTLRYSATHRRAYNMVYRLDPVQAYQQHLVKHIEVDSVVDDPDFNQPYIAVQDITATKKGITAHVEIDVEEATGPHRRVVPLASRDADLYVLSHKRSVYRGYVVEELNAGRNVLTFTNGIQLQVGESMGTHRDDIMRVQIRETIKDHLDKELDMLSRFPMGRRVKVLSLFFIDRVAHYVEPQGKIRWWFEDSYQALVALPRYQALMLPSVEKVHNGYFAQDKRGQAKDTRGNTEADNAAYTLIMRDKEQLLSPDEPLRFIFSHSALREGWDNPNVFQICTLNETHSVMKKRQEIGRGLRLPVDEQGQRVQDPEVNRLTVVANEHYEAFARGLQEEMAEAGVPFDRRMVDNKRERQTVRLSRKWMASPEFLGLWEQIKYKTRYAVTFKTSEIVHAAAAEVQAMDRITPPQIHVQHGQIEVTRKGVSAQLTAARQADLTPEPPHIPDLIGYIQQQTELTRTTIAAILRASGRLEDVFIDPQKFLDLTTRTIRRVLQQLLVHGIKYERIEGAEYTMLRITGAEREGFEAVLERYANRLLPATKSVYDATEWDSEVEKRFAEGLEARNDIKLYVKLPRWFKIETPLGAYNPDWAIVKEEPGGPQLYLVRETKGTTDWNALGDDERQKIECGQKHFEALGTDVSYQVVVTVDEV